VPGGEYDILSTSCIAVIVDQVGDFSSFFRKNRADLRQSFIHLPESNPTFRGPSWDEADTRVLILRLSPYRDVDRSTPHLVLASEAATLPGCFADLGFFPSRSDRRILEENGVPLFLGLRSFRKIEDFDLVLVSNSFGLELLNLAYGLRKCGIPLFASERGETCPPVVLGGSNALAVQALFRKTPAGLDCMVDAVFFGEGEGKIPVLVSILGKRGRLKRERLAEASASVPGLWTFQGGRKARKAVLGSPRGSHLPLSYPILNGEEASTARLQISYGCSSFCSFCFEGQDRKPYREVPYEDLLLAALELKRNTGASTLELYSFNFNTHANVFQLLSELNRLFLQVNFMSQRVDFLTKTPGLLAAELAAGKTSFTLGVEGVSARIRAFYRKGLAGETVRSAVDKLLAAKAREIKLFYILSGHETGEDFAEFRSFLKDLKERRTALHPGARLLFSFGLLVRMPYTPLARDRLLLGRDEWKAAISETKRDVETHGFECRLAIPFEEYALGQVLCAGGVERLSGLLVRLAEKGFVYDKELDPAAWDLAAEHLAEGMEELCREKGPDYASPLSEVVEVDESFLARSWREAKSALEGGAATAEIRASCFEEGDGGCIGCGACLDETQRVSLLRHAVKQPLNTREGTEDLARLVKAKRSSARVPVEVMVPGSFAGTHPAWLEAWVLRELFARHPSAVESVFAARRDFPPRELPAGLAWYGRSVFSLLTSDPAGLSESLRSTSVPGICLLEPPGICLLEPSSVPEVRLHHPPSPARGLSVEVPEVEAAAARGAFMKAFESLHLAGTLTRDGGRYFCLFSPKALKKRTILAAEFSEMRDSEGRIGLAAGLMITEKFDLAEFDAALERIFGKRIEHRYEYR